MSSHYLLGSMFSDKKIFVIFTENPLYVTSHFSFYFQDFLFFSTFVCLTMCVYLSLYCLEFSDSCMCRLRLSFYQTWKSFNHYFFKYSFCHFFHSSPLGTPMMYISLCLMISTITEVLFTLLYSIFLG